jgi:hypothetical protein
LQKKRGQCEKCGGTKKKEREKSESVKEKVREKSKSTIGKGTNLQKPSSRAQRCSAGGKAMGLERHLYMKRTCFLMFR